MTNHVHLLASAREPYALSRMMHYLGRRFVQYINHVYRRSGTLWEGRFKASLVDTETYFLRCSRYIECNPVRARMVVDPTDYRWSSYRAHALHDAARQAVRLRKSYTVYPGAGREHGCYGKNYTGPSSQGYCTLAIGL